mgnify:CR=1 FL=1
MRRFDAGGMSSVCCATNMSVDRDPGRRKKYIFPVHWPPLRPSHWKPINAGRLSKLVLAKETAEIASRAKSEFLASVSHEIRTPIECDYRDGRSAMGNGSDPDQRKYLRIFRRAGGNLLSLINDILDLSKVEVGHLELESTAFDLSDLVEKAIEILAMRANEKGLELACHLSPDVPAP